MSINTKKVWEGIWDWMMLFLIIAAVLLWAFALLVRVARELGSMGWRLWKRHRAAKEALREHELGV